MGQTTNYNLDKPGYNENADIATINSNMDKIDDALTSAVVKDRAEKATPADADVVGLVDSADDNKLKKLSWATIKATLKSVTVVQNKTVPVADWQEDDAFENYPYRATVQIEGCTEDHFPDIHFVDSDADSGILHKTAATYDGGVYIYASQIPDAVITIDAMTLTKEVN